MQGGWTKKKRYAIEQVPRPSVLTSASIPEIMRAAESRDH